MSVERSGNDKNKQSEVRLAILADAKSMEEMVASLVSRGAMKEENLGFFRSIHVTLKAIFDPGQYDKDPESRNKVYEATDKKIQRTIARLEESQKYPDLMELLKRMSNNIRMDRSPDLNPNMAAVEPYNLQVESQADAVPAATENRVQADTVPSSESDATNLESLLKVLMEGGGIQAEAQPVAEPVPPAVDNKSQTDGDLDDLLRQFAGGGAPAEEPGTNISNAAKARAKAAVSDLDDLEKEEKLDKIKREGRADTIEKDSASARDELFKYRDKHAKYAKRKKGVLKERHDIAHEIGVYLNVMSWSWSWEQDSRNTVFSSLRGVPIAQETMKEMESDAIKNPGKYPLDKPLTPDEVRELKLAIYSAASERLRDIIGNPSKFPEFHQHIRGDGRRAEPTRILKLLQDAKSVVDRMMKIEFPEVAAQIAERDEARRKMEEAARKNEEAARSRVETERKQAEDKTKSVKEYMETKMAQLEPFSKSGEKLAKMFHREHPYYPIVNDMAKHVSAFVVWSLTPPSEDNNKNDRAQEDLKVLFERMADAVKKHLDSLNRVPVEKIMEMSDQQKKDFYELRSALRSLNAEVRRVDPLRHARDAAKPANDTVVTYEAEQAVKKVGNNISIDALLIKDEVELARDSQKGGKEKVEALLAVLAKSRLVIPDENQTTIEEMIKQFQGMKEQFPDAVDEILTIISQRAQAYTMIADIKAAQNNPGEAVEYYQKAINALRSLVNQQEFRDDPDLKREIDKNIQILSDKIKNLSVIARITVAVNEQAKKGLAGVFEEYEQAMSQEGKLIIEERDKLENSKLKMKPSEYKSASKKFDERDRMREAKNAVNKKAKYAYDAAMDNLQQILNPDRGITDEAYLLGMIRKQILIIEASLSHLPPSKEVKSLRETYGKFRSEIDNQLQALGVSLPRKSDQIKQPSTPQPSTFDRLKEGLFSIFTKSTPSKPSTRHEVEERQERNPGASTSKKP